MPEQLEGRPDPPSDNLPNAMRDQPGDMATRQEPVGRKPYVRRLTEKRREQNRRAQKLYRERMKKKTEEAEERAALAKAAEVQTPQSLSDTHGDASDGLLASLAPGFSPNPCIMDFEDMFVAAGDLALPQQQQIHYHLEPPPPTPDPVPFEEVNEDYGDLDLTRIWAVPESKDGRPDANAAHAALALTPRHTPSWSSDSGYRSPASTLGNPYTNHLHLIGENNIEACIEVGLAIGITRHSFINDHPSSFPSQYAALNAPSPHSPYHQQTGYTVANTTTMISPQLLSKLQSLYPTLRPTPTQLTHPHPSYIDCLIFPYFRDKAVLASVAGTLDNHALLLDIFKGGLICWGGMPGLTHRRSRRAAKTNSLEEKRDMRQSVTWSTRSWEARKWFLTKWASLVGTEEEEEARGDPDGIWRGSRWWWAMRGEEDSDFEEEEDEVVEVEE